MKNSDTPVGAAGCPSSTPLPKATYTGTPALGGTVRGNGGVWVSGLRAQGSSPTG